MEKKHDNDHTMHKIREPEEKKELIHRLNRIEGQVRGLRNMVENDIYCTEILTQTSAVIAALNSFNRDLLDRHVRSCVADDIKEGNREKMDELLVMLRKLMK